MTARPDGSLLDLAVEFWRLARSFKASAEQLPPERQARALAQWRFATSRLETILADAGVRIVGFDGRVYDPGLPVTIVNADEVAGSAELSVAQTLEPAFIALDRVLRFGKVILQAGS